MNRERPSWDAFKHGEVHGRLRLLADLVQGVADDAHDFVIDHVRRSLVEMRRNVQVLADGIVTGKVLADELAAHDHFVRSRAAFVVGEEPAAHQRNPEGAEIAGIGPAHQRRRAGLRPA